MELLGDDVVAFSGDPDFEPAGICNDHRRAEAGSLFVCVAGYVADGHAHAAGALTNGAAALVTQKPVEELGIPDALIGSAKAVVQTRDSRRALAAASHLFYAEPSRKLMLAGVTGTKGKTTTSYMIRSIMNAAGLQSGLIGTVENYIGGDSFPAKETTPESLALARLFADMRDRGCSHAVMEVSSQGLALRRVDFCDFDAAVFTNFYNDHVSPNEHKDIGEYFAAKMKLFSMAKHAVVNADIPEFEAVRDAISLCGCVKSMLTYSIKGAGGKTGAPEAGMPEAEPYGKNATEAGLPETGATEAFIPDITASDIEYVNDGRVYTRFFARTPWFSDTVTVAMPGGYNVSNALAAIGVCGLFGIKKEAILEGLLRVSVRGRTQVIDEGQDFTVLVDYAHNAASLEAMLGMLREYDFKSITTVFGCGGNRARDRRFDMGEASGRLSDFTVVTSDNPRNEEPACIIADIETGLLRTDGRYITMEDRATAIRFALENASPGELVLIAGKGHEATQTFADRVIPFDDALTAREILREIYKKAGHSA